MNSVLVINACAVTVSCSLAVLQTALGAQTAELTDFVSCTFCAFFTLRAEPVVFFAAFGAMVTSVCAQRIYFVAASALGTMFFFCFRAVETKAAVLTFNMCFFAFRTVQAFFYCAGDAHTAVITEFAFVAAIYSATVFTYKTDIFAAVPAVSFSGLTHIRIFVTGAAFGAVKHRIFRTFRTASAIFTKFCSSARMPAFTAHIAEKTAVCTVTYHIFVYIDAVIVAGMRTALKTAEIYNVPSAFVTKTAFGTYVRRMFVAVVTVFVVIPAVAAKETLVAV